MSGREHLGGRSDVGGFFVVVVILAALLAIARFASLTGSEPRPGATSDLGELADPEATYDPVRAGERLPTAIGSSSGVTRSCPSTTRSFLPAHRTPRGPMTRW